MSNFKVEITSTEYSPVVLATTHNGYQWHALNMNVHELRELVKEAQRFLDSESAELLKKRGEI